MPPRRAGTALLAANDAAWARLWASRIDVLGDRTLAADVNASEFYLLSSTRDGVDWSVSPAGLSSNGYDGHIFWDAETWMFPSLLALHPTLADAMETYRFDRLARRGAARHRHRSPAGARFPWESALDGTEQIPPPVSVNSEGLYEQHITADIALAQWQYYVATGDRQWLAAQGWPVLSGAARFWAVARRPRARRALPHHPRHRARRGEPERHRRGVHRTSARAPRCATRWPRLGCSGAPPRGRGRRSPPAWPCRSTPGWTSTPSTPATAGSWSSRPT